MDAGSVKLKMQKKNTTCSICRGDLWSDIEYLNENNHSLFSSRSISICMQCGFGQIDPKINKNDLDEYYVNIYRSENSAMHIDFRSSYLNMNLIDYRSISQLLLSNQYLANKQEYRFLDIGAGFGESFVSARNILPGNVFLYAIESNNDAKDFYTRFLPGISICENLSEIKDEIDVVLMSHSLEHFDIDDMRSLFQDIYDVLGENGIVIIEVPHDDLRDENYSKERINDTPHLSFFSLESLRRLIDKLEFELCFINTVGELLNVSYPKDNNPIRIQAKTHTKNGMGKLKSVKNPIKKAAIYVGLFEFLSKIYARLICYNPFYENINFTYGGPRSLIRCVLRKNGSMDKPI
jgi:SAM-dependent methyltransferase